MIPEPITVQSKSAVPRNSEMSFWEREGIEDGAVYGRSFDLYHLLGKIAK
jgi:hypothetical protein